ncbi:MULTISPECIES: hypothetical protein [unclassified Arthrobacter]|uniref:hypothetical protein n=1 Tax=unclassified Arthrobacter TaxID=235627 RepID=UPI001E36EB4C|nr:MULTISPECIES: hypothetical protein [unclassified Arthrobacter]MCC9146591.1 hypothetical protein [Arthrobacter sp. zg-Y919]MDK1277821.1 hypothetical protein [Arthrobacter sp. zg.Y919]MDM7989680.1 hypothetical protein [Arthrobacter sp. zg-Y877]WIB02225.1 hypothetical protein QNO10_09640 [Arthrobacter sp. zg-Y919]
MGNKESGREDQPKTGSQGPDGTIPQSEDGIAAASTEEPSNFEPEEDDAADDGK